AAPPGPPPPPTASSLPPPPKPAEPVPPPPVPDGELVTVPEPDPFFATASVCRGGIATPIGMLPAVNGEPGTSVNPPPGPIENADTLPETSLVTYRCAPSALPVPPTRPSPAVTGHPRTP